MGNQQNISVDLETKGFITKGVVPDIVCVSVYGEEISFCQPWNADTKALLLELAQNFTFIFHNNSFDRAVLRGHGIIVPNFEDTMIMSYVWEPDSEHSLASWGDRLDCPKLTQPWSGKYPTEWTPELEAYCLRDAELTYKLYSHLVMQFEVDPVAWNVYKLIELPYSIVIQEMERIGLYLDLSKMQAVKDELNKQLKVVSDSLTSQFPRVLQETVVYKTMDKNKRTNLEFVEERDIGEGKKEYVFNVYGAFNPNSARQVADVLQQAGWKPKKKTAKGAVKTDESTLEEIQEEPAATIATQIIEYKELNKAVTGFVEPLAGEHVSKDGFVRGKFNQCAVITGRLSSSNPNLQNIPRRGELGKKMRAVFTAPEGWSLFDGDLSNIEARMVAYFMWLIHDDDSLARVFIEGKDFHSSNSEAWGVNRDAAKTVFFAKIYGAGIGKISKSLRCTYPEAKAIVKTIDTKCPALQNLIDDVIFTARDSGGILHTLLGRRLVYVDLLSDIEAFSKRAERQVFNALIQGSSADVLKVLTLDSMSLIRDHDACVAAAVHDELLGYVPNQSSEALVYNLSKRWSSSDLLMIPGKGKIPITTEFKVADCWLAAH